MARQSYLQNVRKAGAFVNGELKAGEWGLDVTNGDWYFSRNGTTVELLESAGPGGAAALNDLTDVQLASLAEGNLLSYDATAGQWINRTLAQAGIIPTTQRGTANGVATLGGDGKIPTTQLPALAVNDTFVVASQTAQLALTAQAGDIAIRTDLGVTYVHNGGTAGTMVDWTEIKANDTTVDGSHVTSGDIAAARIAANIVAALNNAPVGTIANANLTWDCGTL